MATPDIQVSDFDPNSMSAPGRMVAGIVDAGPITPGDDSTFDYGYKRWIYIGVSGDLSYQTYSGKTVVLKNLPVGWWYIWSKRVNETATTAEELLWGS